jgi:uncharacterized protein
MDADERQRLMRDARQAFNAGDFYAAHEHWEALWLETAGSERRWLQALIQVATGLYHLQRSRADLCRGLLVKALAKLDDAPPRLDEIDLVRLRRDASELVRALERGESPAHMLL